MAFDEILEKEPSIHLGRNTQRVREIIGMKQSTLARNVGMSQQNISKLEQSSVIPDETLELLAKGLGVTPEFIKNFNEEKAIYNIQNTYDNSTHNQHYRPTIHNEISEAERSFHDKVLADKDEQIKLLREELAATRNQLNNIITKLTGKL
jgi:transcriptional regulator with XRE-family HTH domain